MSSPICRLLPAALTLDAFYERSVSLLDAIGSPYTSLPTPGHSDSIAIPNVICSADLSILVQLLCYGHKLLHVCSEGIRMYACVLLVPPHSLHGGVVYVLESSPPFPHTPKETNIRP